jgi:hypothetical protein
MAGARRRRQLGVTVDALEASAVRAGVLVEARRLVGVADVAVARVRDGQEMVGVRVAERAVLGEMRLALAVAPVTSVLVWQTSQSPLPGFSGSTSPPGTAPPGTV